MIELEGVSVTYGAGSTLLQAACDVRFAFRLATHWGLVGESGATKARLTRRIIVTSAKDRYVAVMRTTFAHAARVRRSRASGTKNRFRCLLGGGMVSLMALSPPLRQAAGRKIRLTGRKIRKERAASRDEGEIMSAYVLAAGDGEQMFQSSGEIVIKVDPTRGSNDLSLGTQLMPLGAGVPRHVHAYWDEVIYVLDGSGFVTLNDERVPIHKGATVFVPKGVWHGFENPASELFILWAATPTGQEEFFRAISSRPGEPSKNLSREQVLAVRHQVEADHLKRVQSP